MKKNLSTKGPLGRRHFLLLFAIVFSIGCFAMLVSAYAVPATSSVELTDDATALDFVNFPTANAMVASHLDIDFTTYTSIPNPLVAESSIRAVVPYAYPVSGGAPMADFPSALEFPDMSASQGGSGYAGLQTSVIRSTSATELEVVVEVALCDSPESAAGALLTLNSRESSANSIASDFQMPGNAVEKYSKNEYAGLGDVNLVKRDGLNGSVYSLAADIAFYRSNVYVSIKSSGTGMPDLVGLAGEIDATIQAALVTPQIDLDAQRPLIDVILSEPVLYTDPSGGPMRSDVTVIKSDPNLHTISFDEFRLKGESVILKNRVNPTYVAKKLGGSGVSEIFAIAVNDGLLCSPISVVAVDVVTTIMPPELRGTYVDIPTGQTCCNGEFLAGESRLRIRVTQGAEIKVEDSGGLSLYHGTLEESIGVITLSRAPILGETLTISDLSHGSIVPYVVKHGPPKATTFTTLSVSRSTPTTLTIYGENFTALTKVRIYQPGQSRIETVVTLVSANELEITTPILPVGFVNGTGFLTLWDDSHTSNLGWENEITLTN